MTDTPVVWSNSRLACYRRCPMKYHFRYDLGLKKKRRALPLVRGDWLHQLLEVHYTGGDWRYRMSELCAEYDKLFEEEKEELGPLPDECKRIFTSYLAHYRKHDEGMRVIGAEIDEQVDLPNGDRLRVIVDLLVQAPDKSVWIWDHKTVSSFMPADFMVIDSQLVRYVWAMRKLGVNVAGIMFNEIVTTVPTIPEQLKSGELTRRANLRCDLYTYYRELRRLNLNPDDYRDVLGRLRADLGKWFRRTHLPKDPALTKRAVQEILWTAEEAKAATAAGKFPRTPSKACSWDCDYLAPCMVTMMGGDIDAMIGPDYERREDTAKEARRNG